ncbi:MAG: glycerophosphodiester phosphodiesterase [Pseudomonadales bacterium]
MIRASLLLLVANLMSVGMVQAVDNTKIVIAHRGASGYLPEHTLAAKAAAHVMGADYIEQDVVMTKDDHLVVLHDPYLDRVTNVIEKFPKRARTINGTQRWLAIDFTLAEIKTLSASQGFHYKSDDNKTPITDYPNRFPVFKSRFSVPTLQEEIELIQGMNHSMGKNVGVYVEIKAPWLHLMEGKDISKAVLTTLKEYGYSRKSDKAYVQCFDAEEVLRIHDELYPELGTDLKLVQLIAPVNWGETLRLREGKLQPYDSEWLFKPGAMKTLARYADGIGPWKSLLVSEKSTVEKMEFGSMVKDAQAAGLLVHPFTFRLDPGRVPDYARDFEHLLEIFLYGLGVDGVFTDFPDRAVDFLSTRQH